MSEAFDRIETEINDATQRGASFVTVRRADAVEVLALARTAPAPRQGAAVVPPVRNDIPTRPRLSLRTVRVRTNSVCRVLGRFVRETNTSFVYRRESDSRIVSARRTARARSAGFPNPEPHIIPCPSCEDHPQSRFAPGRCRAHGNPEPCTTCMET